MYYGQYKLSRQFVARFSTRILRLKCDGTHAGTIFRLSAKRMNPFKSARASVQSTTGSRGVSISGSNAGYTMFRGSVKSTGYPLHSPVSSSLPLPASPCAITFQLGSTSLLTPCSTVLLEKQTGFQLVKKFLAFYGTRKFITAYSSARHLSLFWASSIHSISLHPTSWTSALILSSHLRLGLPSGLVPSDFPTKTLYTSLLSHMRATCPAHLILLDFITKTILGEEYR